jgi:hypothetical protein|uniref:Dof zinc finger protein n=1 Tax=Fagus sylvatica TaxID=28930 RepID=A0A2N9EP47_FAGSY
MQQDRDGEGSEDMKPQQHHQDRRLKPMMQVENQQQQQQQQPQKCPRCESLNTKFCYYNNYSLSQPRFFCKTCRRYWTQGGTLRNVPVGGGCRKGKRAKTSSSSSSENNSSRSQQPQQQNLTNPPARIPSNPVITTISPPSMPSISSYFAGGGGYLSSLAAIQSLNQSQSYSQALSVGDDLGGSSNLALLQGFSTVPSFGSQQQHHRQIQQAQFYQMGNRDRSMESHSLYPTEEALIPSNRPTSSSQHDWHQSFINNTNPTVSDANLWSISTTATTTTTTGNANNNNNSGSSLNPSHWPDLPGYGPPP